MGGKAQVSAELIIVIAAILAVALILVVQLQKTATEWSKKGTEIDKKLESGVDKTVSAAKTGSEKKKAGADCSKDSDCESGDCGYGGTCG
ncbi:MAG: hypothetical protein ABIF01_00720 [Candidatus Micrarchaeota archaeon]